MHTQDGQLCPDITSFTKWPNANRPGWPGRFDFSLQNSDALEELGDRVVARIGDLLSLQTELLLRLQGRQPSALLFHIGVHEASDAGRVGIGQRLGEIVLQVDAFFQRPE